MAGSHPELALAYVIELPAVSSAPIIDYENVRCPGFGSSQHDRRRRKAPDNSPDKPVGQQFLQRELRMYVREQLGR